MDYGYQLLRHVMTQVFGNLGSAARITLVLLLIPAAILAITNPGILTGEFYRLDVETGQNDFSGIGVAGLIIAFVVAAICWFWAAVAWHRFVLLEEYPTGLFPKWHGTKIGNYFGNGVLVFLIVLAIGFALGIVIGIVALVFQSEAVALFLGFGLLFGLSWTATRIGLILPAAAIGEQLRVGESWKATAPVSGQIILPLFVLTLAAAIVKQAIIAAFGDTTTIMTAFGEQQQVTLNGIGMFLSFIAWWLQMLVNLALMTTLYGNLIEGRQLN